MGRQILNGNGETHGSIRGKINSNFEELYGSGSLDPDSFMPKEGVKGMLKVPSTGEVIGNDHFGFIVAPVDKFAAATWGLDSGANPGVVWLAAPIYHPLVINSTASLYDIKGNSLGGSYTLPKASQVMLVRNEHRWIVYADGAKDSLYVNIPKKPADDMPHTYPWNQVSVMGVTPGEGYGGWGTVYTYAFTDAGVNQSIHQVFVPSANTADLQVKTRYGFKTSAMGDTWSEWNTGGSAEPTPPSSLGIRIITNNTDKKDIENLAPGSMVKVASEENRIEQYLGDITEPEGIFLKVGGVRKLLYSDMDYYNHRRYLNFYSDYADRVDLTYEATQGKGWVINAGGQTYITHQECQLQDLNLNGLSTAAGVVSDFTPLYPIALLCGAGLKLLAFDPTTSNEKKLVMRDPYDADYYIEMNWDTGVHKAHLGSGVVRTSNEAVTFPWEATMWNHTSGPTWNKVKACSAPSHLLEDNNWLDILPSCQVYVTYIPSSSSGNLVVCGRGIASSGAQPRTKTGWNSGAIIRDVRTSHPRWEVRVIGINGTDITDSDANSRVAHIQGDAQDPNKAFGYISMNMNKIRSIHLQIKAM